MRGRALGCLVAVAVLVGCTDEGDFTDGSETLTVPVYENRQGHVSNNLGTHMSGGEEVPARQTIAKGQAYFQRTAEGIRYRVVVQRLDNLTQAHIHMAPAGSNGGIVAWLYPSAPPLQLIPGTTTGILAEGMIVDAEVVGLLAGQGVSALWTQMQAGNTYVNVHTTLYPGGEIRGQID